MVKALVGGVGGQAETLVSETAPTDLGGKAPEPLSIILGAQNITSFDLFLRESDVV